MDTLFTMLFLAVFCGIGFWMNQNRLKKERKANPIGSYIIRASHAWMGAPPYMRNIMLESAGISDELARVDLLEKEWHRLPDYAQTGLLKLQMATEIQASMLADPNGRLKG